MAIQNIDQYIEKLPKERRDWLEVFGNQWAPTKQMPGTCEACVWGSGYEHTCDLGKYRVHVNYIERLQDQVKLQGQLNAYMNGQIEIMNTMPRCGGKCGDAECAEAAWPAANSNT